jgi:ankyrin repeat protein
MTSGSSTSPTAAAHKRTQSLSSSAHRHHPVRSPSDRHSSITKSQSPSPERTRKRAVSSRTAANGHSTSKTSNGHGDSEAETDILSDEEQHKTKPKKKIVKREPKDDADTTSISSPVKSEPSRSHTISRASSVNGDVADKQDRKPNGADRCENGYSKSMLKDKPRLPNELNKNSSRAQSADITTSPNEQSDRSRQAHSAEPRKRKFSDAQRPSKFEPPRQKPRLDETVQPAKSQKHRPSSPTTPGTPGLRSSHRRSASTQSNLPSAGLSATRVRRDISSTSLPPTAKEWATSDMSSDEAASYPPIPKLAPPPRSGRAAYRAMTSPTRQAPTGKRADRFGSTPLAKACEKGNFAAVKQAYEEAPGEVDQPDNGGFAPLQKAALEGHTDIVQFLLEKGCRRDCCSKDEQDTPLIDAVENGHLDVVKLLLDHGVNPHHQNKSGKRAIDAIDEDEDYAQELRQMLQKAMQNFVGSESDSDDDDNQDFPLIRPEDKNRTDLLYLEPNRKNLLEYSRKGDVVAVDHFLSSVKPDNESAVVAARAGHHLVLNLLLASAGQQLEKDPDPTKYDETPLLAAIGRGHLKVIKLLVQQDNFNPTRKTKDGKTYWEIAEERRGPRWQTEKEVLKEYYEAYLSKRKVQKRKRQHEAEKTDGKKPSSIKELSSPPQTVKQKKVSSKPPLLSPNTKEAKRKYRPVLESSESEGSDDEVRVRKKPMRERRSSMASRGSKDEPLSPVASRKSSDTKRIKGEDSRGSKDSSKPGSRKPSSEKRHSTDSKIDDRPEKPVKASTPEAIREARKAEEEAKAAKAAEKAAETERKKREAEEAAAKEAARKAEEERLRKEKEERELKEAEEHERREKAEREERERRVAALPTALRVAVQKGASRPLHFRPSTKEHPEELGISMQFLPIQTAPLRNIDPACEDSRRDELWMMNFQVVGMLGLASELRMTEFLDWERKPVTDEHRELFLDNYDLSKLAQEYRWPQAGEAGYNYADITNALKDTREAFRNMEPLQWVRYKDFEGALARSEYKHLESLRLRTCNCRIKEEPDSAIDISFLFDDDEPSITPAQVNTNKTDSVTSSVITEDRKVAEVT